MVQSFSRPRWFALLLGLVLLVSSASLASAAVQKPVRSPSDTVREFYKALREKRFREAFDMSMYQAAIAGLKPAEFEDLRPDFEKLAAAIPERVDINGEEISGGCAGGQPAVPAPLPCVAKVFLKFPTSDEPNHVEGVDLMRVDGNWIIGDQDNYAIVKKASNRFFFNARIDTHHDEVQQMLVRINLAQLAYAQQHQGVFGDMPTLIAAGLLPKDLEGTDSTGYRFQLVLAKDAKTFIVTAEPAQYGRTGKLSFFMNHEGVRSADAGGKPLPPPPAGP